VLSSAEHGSIAYPTHWYNGNTLRVQMHRERERAGGADWEPSPGLHWVKYRLARNGSHRETAHYDPAEVPDIRDWLTERLGPLAELSDPQLHAPQERHTKSSETEHPASLPVATPMRDWPADDTRQGKSPVPDG